MKSLKNVFVASALSAAMAMPAFASESPSMAAPLPQFSAADARLIFEADAKPMQLAALSQQEMMETEGAWVNFAVGGVVGGAWQGARFAWGAGQGHHAWNTNRFLRNVGTGAVIGATTGQIRFLASGVSGIRNLATPGGAVWAANGAAAHWGVNHIWRR